VKKLIPLLLLYFSQGLPFGFQATTLPLLLRSRGVSLQSIGFAGLLSAPWLAKALWAPWVDRYGSERIGRRKSWILPMQAALAVCAFCAGRVHGDAALFALIFAMNLCAATQDIAVDALAVSWLDADELGPGNAIQVVGYKFGMLTGGGLLTYASAQIGYRGLFDAMAGLMFVVLVIVAFVAEPAQPSKAAVARVRLRDVLAQLRAVLQLPAAGALVAVVLTYKLGETLADAMWKPMLFDRGFTASDIGLWTGTYGMVASLLGSSISGIAVRRVGLVQALFWVSALRALGVAAEYGLTMQSEVGAGAVITVTCLEHLVGGAITTVLFALMMQHTEREIGATHYTFLASLEVWGKLPAGALSGVLAQRIGYPSLFALATGLCVAFSALVGAVRPRLVSAEHGTQLEHSA
jgi:PAT family beta-lactamase induction signal transducer AmpG